jgi:hypothetical protein
MTQTQLTPEQELAEEVAACYSDPRRFVRVMYPWGEPDGPLAQYDGPDVWQAEFLERLGQAVRTRRFNGKTPVAPIRMATSSGHGIGKSTLVAWIVNWIMSTRENSRGTITANTFTQVKDKTWASIRKWTPLCLTGHWFDVTSERMSHTAHPATWFCSAQSCREENSEAFAGQHAADSTSFYLFDEASAVPDSIYEVAEGGLTDGEPMMFLFGNPTRSTGRFHQACFGSARGRWDARTIDSRECAFTNKAQIAEWAEDYGEDSDFFRVRVRGLPPQASEVQFIANDLVFAAQTREATALTTDPVICGLDIARGGADSNVFRFRRGADARSIEAIRIPGEHTRDSMVLVAKAADLLENGIDNQPIAAMFIDGTGIGGPIVDRLKQLGYDQQVVEIQFGWKAPDLKYANMRAYMWGRLRDWLQHGAIDDTPVLEQDLTGPGYTHNSRDQLLLESKEHMKKRDLDSPDDGDALALTFAAPVSPTAEANDVFDWGASRDRGHAGWMY